jgi:hypothetical protein
MLIISSNTFNMFAFIMGMYALPIENFC